MNTKFQTIADPVSHENTTNNSGAPRLNCDKDIHLLDVIDFASLQAIQDSFARVTGVATVILDLEGNFITRPSNFSEVCILVQDTIEGRRRCEKSNNIRSEKALKSKEFVYHKCLSCGFLDGSVPIFIGEYHVANWLIGQCNASGVTRDEIARYADEIGADKQRMLEAFDKMPVMSIDKFEHALSLHYEIAREFSRLSLNILLLRKEILDKQQMASQLETSERYLSECFNSVMEGIVIIDCDNIIQFANKSAGELFGTDSLDEIIGKKVLELFEGEQRELARDEWLKRHEGKSSKYEIQIKNFHGQFITLLVSSTPRFSRDGKFKGAFTSMIDITEHKRLQEYVSRAQRLETAGRIAAQVAHDFNNLLGPLVAYPEIISKYLPENSPACQLLQDMDKSATLMAEINQQLLTLGRRGHYNLETIDVNEMILQSLENIGNDLDGIEVDLNLSKSVMGIKGGGSQLIRVITNLINNSIDALNGKGLIRINTENYYVDHSNHELYQIPQGEYVKITITDNGCGISSESLPLIYDPFYTTKKSDVKRGSGLGLSVVHSVVQDHHGYINIESEPGKGTSVYLYFPLIREKKQENDEIGDITGNESLLIVDDDTVQRSVARNLLSDLGYHVSLCKSGEEAVYHLQNNDYDLVILDMIMPNGMDGARTYEEILKIKPGQKAIIVSGYADSERVDKARKLGISGFVGKPLKARDIGKAIRSILDSAKK